MIKCPGAVTRATPTYFLAEAIPLVQDSELKALLDRYAAMPDLTYQDVAILFMQVLPVSVFNAWPSVALKPPLDIPALSSFNSNFSREWWYFNVNGHVHEVSDDSEKKPASRFYMLRVLKRFRQSTLPAQRMFLGYFTILFRSSLTTSCITVDLFAVLATLTWMIRLFTHVS